MMFKIVLCYICNYIYSYTYTMSLIATWFSPYFNYFRHNFVEMVNVSSTNFWSQSIPELLNPFLELRGLYIVLRYCFIEPHTFSMGFKSGLLGGVLHQIIPCSVKNMVTAMLWVIILLESVPIRKALTKKWQF